MPPEWWPLPPTPEGERARQERWELERANRAYEERMERERKSEEPGCAILFGGLAIVFLLAMLAPDHATLILVVGWPLILVVLHLVVDRRRGSDDGR